MKQNLSLMGLLILLLLGGIHADRFANAADDTYSNYPLCDYRMCQYEKNNIDQIILSRARKSQTVMFGEIHDTVTADSPPPLEDSLYVTSLLNSLKSMGYNYLALEVSQSAPAGTHSHDVMAFLDQYDKGYLPAAKDYPFAKPGWLDLIRAALFHGYKLIFINRLHKGYDRDKAMFYALKADIFDHDPTAKVLIYIGANHISESNADGGYSHNRAGSKRLGYYLDNYTNGHNFSVYMGYPSDTPAGCDLFISHFIWDIYQK